MSDKTDKKIPTMATIDGVSPPRNRSPRDSSRATIIILIVVIVLLLIALFRPAELDVYKKPADIAFADPVLAECVSATAARHDWIDAGHFVTLRCNNPSGDRIRSLDGIELLQQAFANETGRSQQARSESQRRTDGQPPNAELGIEYRQAF